MSLFVKLEDRFEVNWPAAYELHQKLAQDPTKPPASRDHHRTQAFLIWTKHLKTAPCWGANGPRTRRGLEGRPKGVWTWERACEAARSLQPPL